MRTIFILTFLANIAYKFGTSPHFVDALFNSILLGMVMVLILVFSSTWFLSKRGSWWGTPHRDYWLNDDNRSKSISQARCYIAMIGIFGMLFILFVQVVPSELVRPYRHFLLGVFFVVIFVHTIWYYWSFSHLPKEASKIEPSTQE